MPDPPEAARAVVVGGAPVGRVTSGRYGHRAGALDRLRAAAPLYDADGARIRGAT